MKAFLQRFAGLVAGILHALIVCAFGAANGSYAMWQG